MEIHSLAFLGHVEQWCNINNSNLNDLNELLAKYSSGHSIHVSNLKGNGGKIISLMLWDRQNYLLINTIAQGKFQL